MSDRLSGWQICREGHVYAPVVGCPDGMSTSLFEYEPRDWGIDADGTARFALVGIGWWTSEFVLPAVEKVDYCTTTTVVSSSTEKTDRVCEAYETIEHGLLDMETVAAIHEVAESGETVD